MKTWSGAYGRCGPRTPGSTGGSSPRRQVQMHRPRVRVQRHVPGTAPPGDAGAGGHRRGAGIGGVIGAPAYTGGGLVPSAARLLSSRAAPAAAMPRSPATTSGLGDEGRKKGNDSGPPSAIPARSSPPPSPASPSGGSPTRAVAAPATVAPRPAPRSAVTGRSSG